MNRETLTPQLLAKMPYAELSDLEEKAKKAVKKVTAVLVTCAFTAKIRTNLEIIRAGYEIDKTLIRDEIQNRCDLIPSHVIRQLIS